MRSIIILLSAFLTLCAADVTHIKPGYKYDKPQVFFSELPSFNYAGQFNYPTQFTHNFANEFNAHQVRHPFLSLPPASPSSIVQFEHQFGGIAGHPQFAQRFDYGFNEPVVHFQQSDVYQPPKVSIHYQENQHVHQFDQPVVQHVQDLTPSVRYNKSPPKVLYDNENHQNAGGVQTFESITYDNKPRTVVNDHSSEEIHTNLQLPALVSKNIYVYSGEDEVEHHPTRYIHVGQPQKKLNVLFVKTPTYTGYSKIVPILPQNEEKTVLYVLSKKPEFNQDIEIQQPEPLPAIKPDVNYLKYTNEAEAQNIQQQITGQYETGATTSGNAQFDVPIGGNTYPTNIGQTFSTGGFTYPTYTNGYRTGVNGFIRPVVNFGSTNTRFSDGTYPSYATGFTGHSPIVQSFTSPEITSTFGHTPGVQSFTTSTNFNGPAGISNGFTSPGTSTTFEVKQPGGGESNVFSSSSTSTILKPQFDENKNIEYLPPKKD